MKLFKKAFVSIFGNEENAGNLPENIFFSVKGKSNYLSHISKLSPKIAFSLDMSKTLFCCKELRIQFGMISDCESRQIAIWLILHHIITTFNDPV